jgi:hypothetical protein
MEDQMAHFLDLGQFFQYVGAVIYNTISKFDYMDYCFE